MSKTTIEVHYHGKLTISNSMSSIIFKIVLRDK